MEPNGLVPEGEEPEGGDPLADLLGSLPDAPPVVGAPAAPAPAVDPNQFVPKAQFDEMAQRMEQLRSVMPIAEALAQNPQQAEQLRHSLIMGNVAAPGTYAANAGAPALAPLPGQGGQPALTPEVIERLRTALIDNPMNVIAPIARGMAEQMINERLAPLQSANAQTALYLFKSTQQSRNSEEYAAVSPYFERALAGLDPNLLASSNPQALQAFLDVTYRASRGDAYAEANAQPIPGATPRSVTGVPAAPALQRPPQYSGAAGSPSQPTTSPLVRAAHRRGDQTAQQVQAEAANRAGLTKADIEKYGREVQNEIGA